MAQAVTQRLVENYYLLRKYLADFYCVHCLALMEVVMSDSEFVRKDVHDANLDTILILIDKTNERINDLKDSINRQFAIMGITIGAIQLGLALILYFLTKH